MQRKNLDKKILAAIEKLKEEGKAPRYPTFKRSQASGVIRFIHPTIRISLRSDAGSQRKSYPSRRSPTSCEVAPVVAPVQAKTTDIDLFYKLLERPLP